MKSFIVAACIVACVYAASPDQDAEVLRSTYEQNPEGSYQYSYETSNGISGQVSASVKNAGTKEEALEVTGQNSYPGPDGQQYSLTFVANENGYQPQADFLPTPPPPQPIPDYILRSLEWAAAHPYVEKKSL